MTYEEAIEGDVNYNLYENLYEKMWPGWNSYDNHNIVEISSGPRLRLDLGSRNDVVYVFIDEKLVLSEFEDNFPSDELIGKLRLFLL